MLKKKFRLTKKDDISSIIRDGRKFPGKLFLCKAKENNLSHNRYTVVTSKKVEKKAVRRNRCRRRIYEALRKNIHTTHPQKQYFDIVLLTNKNCIEAPFSEIEKEVTHIQL